MTEILIGDIKFTNEEQAEVAARMVNEMRGRLLQAVVVQRLLDRKKLANKLTTADMNADGQNRAQIASLRTSIGDLEDIHTELLAEIEKGK